MRVQRAFENRWFAGAFAITLGYLTASWMLSLIYQGYNYYYFYPRFKGGEYPPFRYTFVLAAVVLWLAVGLWTASLAGRCALFRKGANLAARSLIVFMIVFVLLIVGVIGGVAVRFFRW
jgi:hypothetical protein